MTVGLAAQLLLDSNGESDEHLTAVAGLFVALVALAVSVAQLFPPLPMPSAEQAADDLAETVRTEWGNEVQARQLRNPRVVPLTWSATDRPVADAPDIGPGTRLLRQSLDGRLHGAFDEAARRLAEGYSQVPSRRLVVLGEPGAGKTVLAAMLTLGLLAERTPHAPVPVLLNISSWDPVTESLDDWITDYLATAYYGGRPRIPRLLLDRQSQNRPLILPVLDGLDEIPEAARRNAVRSLNESCDDGRGLVLTCRSTEYQDVIEGGSPVLRRAPVVEVTPVSVADATAYLQEVSWPAGVDWEPVYAHMRACPQGPLTTALSTPLALSLARTVYRSCTRDPSELLGFDSSHAVEDHLIDHLITAAYAPPPGSSAQQAADSDWQREAARAEKWLTYLATYLHQHRERDLAWWRMSGRLLSRWTGLVLGITAGLVAMLATAVVALLAKPDQGPQDPAVFGGIAFAVLTTITWYATPERAPGRLSLTVRASLARLRQGFLTGVVLTAVPTVPVLVTLAFASTIMEGTTAAKLLLGLEVAGSCVGLITATGLAMAAHAWFDAPPERSTGADPMDLLRQDRKSSLFGALAAGSVLGLVVAPLFILGLSAASMLGFALTSRSVEPSFLDAVTRAGTNALGPDIGQRPLVVFACTVLPAATFMSLLLLTRAWPRFALTRAVLATQGKLPWRYTQFLETARSRQLLRQSGGTYQFRHVRLQERMASRSLAQDRDVELQRRTHRRRRIQAASAAFLLLLAGGAGLQQTLPEKSARASLITGPVDAMAFTPEGETLITTKGTHLRRWSTADGKKRKGQSIRFPHRSNDEPSPFVSSIAVRSDGTIFLLDSFLVLYELPVGKKELHEVARFPEDAVLDSGGTHVIADGGRIRYDTARERRYRTGRIKGFDQGAELGARGSRMVAGAFMENRTILWNRVHGEWTAPSPLGKSEPNGLAISADGSRLALWSDFDTKVRSLNGGLKSTSVPDVQKIGHAALNRDGSMLATTGSSDSTDAATTQLWDTAEPESTS